MRRYNKTVSNWEKSFREQMREIKYSLIEKLPPGRELNDQEKDEYRKLAQFMAKTAKFLLNIRDHEKPKIIPKILIPTMTLKVKTFVKENCPLYASRLK